MKGFGIYHLEGSLLDNYETRYSDFYLTSAIYPHHIQNT